MEQNPYVILNARFFDAITYSVDQHRMQVRKETSIPYICHPLGVASLILEALGDEDQVIAALLHDVAEDCGGEPRLAEIGQKFGSRVERIVRGCSDSLTEDPDNKAPWRARKEEHLSHLAKADHDVLIVTAADKTHNARSIVTDLECFGPSLWSRFKRSSPDQIIWYYDSVYAVLENGRITPTLLAPLKNAIAAMKAF